jgi:hypothetical protein
MGLKNHQDHLKSINSDKYNPALRETIKLATNSLSGKLMEDFHTTITKIVHSHAEYEKIVSEAESIESVNTLSGNICVTYKINPENMKDSQQRPIYLAVLIYDYAKKYMYDYSYSKIGLNKLLYTDTDSTKLKYSDFITWKKWIDDNNITVPHWKEVEFYDNKYASHKIYEHGSKVFGSFEDEFDDMQGGEYTFYCLQKKSWLYACKNNDKFKTKMRFKGLGQNTLMLALDEPFIDNSKIIKHRAKKNSPAWDETIYNIKKNSCDQVYIYFNENKNKYFGVGDSNEHAYNQLAFFDKLYNDGSAYVLVQTFNKLYRKNNIQLTHTMKHITIKNNLTNDDETNDDCDLVTDTFNK